EEACALFRSHPCLSRTFFSFYEQRPLLNLSAITAALVLHSQLCQFFLAIRHHSDRHRHRLSALFSASLIRPYHPTTTLLAMRFLTALSLTALFAALTGPCAAATQSCNGDPSLCAKKYSQVTYVMTHKSFAYQAGNSLSTQHNDIPTQLHDGVRGFMFEAHLNPVTNPAGIELCFASCSALDAGSLVTILEQISLFLIENPSEVVTIFWNNAQNVPLSTLQTVYQQSGLMGSVYQQPTGSLDWPTLGDMVTSNKRVVNFIDSGADSNYPWLHMEYLYVWETSSNNPDTSSFSSCAISVPAQPVSPTTMLNVMNHYLTTNVTIDGQMVAGPQFPDTTSSTNAQSLADQGVLCRKDYVRNPAFLTVDFYDEGGPFQVAAALNGINYTAPTVSGATSTPTPGVQITVSSGATEEGMGRCGVVIAAVVLGVTAVWGLV
ncbi:PLC-like phosphodiesterase, partial [Endogone sp. FLAS-F59071]